MQSYANRTYKTNKHSHFIANRCYKKLYMHKLCAHQLST